LLFFSCVFRESFANFVVTILAAPAKSMNRTGPKRICKVRQGKT